MLEPRGEKPSSTLQTDLFSMRDGLAMINNGGEATCVASRVL